MQGFACFCNEFKVPLDIRSITEVYKRSQENSMPLVFEQFNTSITKLGIKHNLVMLEHAKKRQLDIRKELTARTNSTDPETVRKTQKQFEGMTDDKLKEAKNVCLNDIKARSVATEDSCRTAIIELLEVNDTKFRQKIIGYEKHWVNNMNLVNRIIKNRKKQNESSSDVSSFRRPYSPPKSLQAGAFAYRVSQASIESKPREPEKSYESTNSNTAFQIRRQKVIRETKQIDIKQ